MGPAAGTAAALRMLVRGPRERLRRERLRRLPLRASAAAVRTALGGRSAAAALRGPVLDAMPTVAAFERRLDAMGDGERADLIRRADDVVAHRFDLLGSGPTDLGGRIDWQRDFKSDRSWPLEHVSRLPISYPDGSDIKVPWELSRFQHLPLLAGAHRLTGEERYLDEIGAQLDDWIASNPVEFGANWACTMDVAIRAANWIAALALCAEAAAGSEWVEGAVGSLLLHGRFIRGHPEWAEVRGNHYLADVVGLLPVAALFSAGAEGRAWAEWGAAELVAEMDHQVRADGCDHEASIPYHRLVAELFVCGGQAVDALLPGALPDRYRARLELMLDFVAAYTRPDGLAPQIGDADDGRFLPLGDYGRADPRSHTHLFAQADRPYEPSATSAALPDGGFFVLRGGELYAIVRCGDVGVGGLGSHAHNDQLAFELSWRAHPLVVDPGSYLYTADPDARNTFRSTGFHATLRIDGAEQNELSRDRLFALDDRTRAEAEAWEIQGETAAFAGRHHGFEALQDPAIHERRLALDGAEGAVTITDTVSSRGEHELEWTFPLAPCTVEVTDGGAIARFEAASLTIEASGVTFAVEDGWLSPRYGVREPTPFLRARRRARPGEDVTVFTLRPGASHDGMRGIGTNAV
jgi:hypothetical protein